MQRNGERTGGGLPDIIIFNPDQWRGDVLGHVGNPAAVTPAIDRLVAEEGVSFSRAFCQNPVCTPSRCSFMSGWYPHVRGHRTMHHMLHSEWNEPNLLRILKQHGYFVWWGGKNDLVPGQGDFSPYCDVKFEPTDEDYRRWGCTRREGTHGGDLDWRGDPKGDNFYSFFKGRLDREDDPFYCDRDWANVLGAIDFLRDYRGDQPVCVYLPLSFPHRPTAWRSRGTASPTAPPCPRASRRPPTRPASHRFWAASAAASGCRAGARSAGPSCGRPITGCARASITSSACSAMPCASAGATTTPRSSCSPTTATSPATTGWWRRPRIRSRTA